MKNKLFVLALVLFSMPFISCSSDDDDFVIKAEDAGKHDIALSYTIDF